MTGPLDRIYERVLVLRCQAGDEAAFAELVARYAPRLRYYLRRLLDGEPDDVMQEVWLDVFRGLPRLADAGAFPAWLYRVARDRALRSRRGRRSPGALPEGDWPAPCARCAAGGRWRCPKATGPTSPTRA